jgi:release factor glutamine methyltransferase
LGEPVSRILGEREFWGERFAVSPDVLDPRPDTETLVEAVLEYAASDPLRAWRILDLGVGSGAILGALLRNLPQATGVGVDRSYQACRLAHTNLKNLELAERSSIICGDWMKALAGSFEIIVSNPPYIETSAIEGLAPDVRHYDPQAALDGGMDGLEAYRALAPAIGESLPQGGIAAIEIGIGQSQKVRELFHTARAFECSIRLDLAGRERVILFRA